LVRRAGGTRWFAKSHEIDAQIRDRFLQLHEQLAGERDLGVSAPGEILGFNTKMKNREEKYFLYLPLEHSEDRADQALAHALIQKLGNDKWTRFADTHMMVIERFGRFPTASKRSNAYQPPMNSRFSKKR
jgi:uncharacterized protein (DUF924 family)